MLIDCHTHLNAYGEDAPPVRERADRLLGEMDAAGVDHAVVISSYTVNAHRPSIEELVHELGDEARLTLVEGVRWLGEDRTDLFALEERLNAGVTRGLKIYPGYERYGIDDPSLEALFRVAAKHDVPVMIHTGDTYAKGAKLRHAHPLLVDDIAVDHPDVTFVMCHLGNPWLMDTAQVLYKNRNVYADLSGLTLGQMKNRYRKWVVKRVREMVLYMGGARGALMYGSDWPLVDMPGYIDFYQSLEIPEDHRPHTSWKTSARLFRIDVPASEASL